MAAIAQVSSSCVREQSGAVCHSHGRLVCRASPAGIIGPKAACPIPSARARFNRNVVCLAQEAPEPTEEPTKTAKKSLFCNKCEGEGSVPCNQCNGTGKNAEDFFQGRFKKGQVCWLCRGKRQMLCGECNGAGFLGGFLSR
eukprot:jgi/Mesvir1/19248/Mv03498-RA.1